MNNTHTHAGARSSKTSNERTIAYKSITQYVKTSEKKNTAELVCPCPLPSIRRAACLLKGRGRKLQTLTCFTPLGCGLNLFRTLVVIGLAFVGSSQRGENVFHLVNCD